MTDNTFDVWKRPGNRLIVRGNGFGGTYSPYGEYSWLANRADLPADAVLLTPESKGLEPLRAVNRRMHDRILEDEIALEALRGELAAQKVQTTGELTRLEGELAEAKSELKAASELSQTYARMAGRSDRELAEAKKKPLPMQDCDKTTLSDRMSAAADVLEEAASHMDMRWPNLTFAAEWSPEALRTQADVFEVEDRERAETEQKVERVAEILDGVVSDPTVQSSSSNAARALLAYYTLTPKAVGE